jgi:hypothetical protein
MTKHADQHTTPTPDTEAKEPKLRGQPSAYRPKVQPGVSVTFTQLGLDILQAAHKRTGKSKSDVLEMLLRKHGSEL